MKTGRALLLLWSVALLSSSAAWAAPAPSFLDESLQAALAAAPEGQPVPVIIRLAERADLRAAAGLGRRERRERLVTGLRATAERSQQGLRRALQQRGVTQMRALWVVNALAVSLPAGMIAELAARPEVASITLDAAVSLPQPVPADVPVEAGVALVGAPELWARGLTGENVVVATVDSGADVLHADLGPRWRGGSNSWFDPNGEHPQAPFDHYGHGTGVMGVLVGGSATGSAIGVAPGARWIAVKIFNDAGTATQSVILAAYQWLLDPDGNPATDDAPDVVNNSWILNGTLNLCAPLPQEFHDLIQLFKVAGIAQVFAAGNTGSSPFTSVSPANFPGTFTVGSVGTPLSATVVSDFSARGPSACDGAIYPGLVAPGYGVVIADRTAGGLFPAAWTVGSGTSYAAPAVSGVMALLRGAFPEAPIARLEDALRRSAVDLAAPGPDHSTGYGLVDGVAAFSILNAHARVIGAYENGVWYLDSNADGQWNGTAGGDRTALFGTAAMLPAGGDWNGDAVFDFGVYEGGTWYLDGNGNGQWDGTAGGDRLLAFGTASMKPAAGDWNGDGRFEAGAFENGLWYLDANGNGQWDGTAGGDRLLIFGTGAMTPVPGDWNGDGRFEAGAFENGFWYLDVNGNGQWDGVAGGDRLLNFGTAGMVPVTGDWNDDGVLEVGAFEAGTWYLDANGNGQWDGVAGGDRQAGFGTALMRPTAFR